MKQLTNSCRYDGRIGSECFYIYDQVADFNLIKDLLKSVDLHRCIVGDDIDFLVLGPKSKLIRFECKHRECGNCKIKKEYVSKGFSKDEAIDQMTGYEKYQDIFMKYLRDTIYWMVDNGFAVL